MIAPPVALPAVMFCVRATVVPPAIVTGLPDTAVVLISETVAVIAPAVVEEPILMGPVVVTPPTTAVTVLPPTIVKVPVSTVEAVTTVSVVTAVVTDVAPMLAVVKLVNPVQVDVLAVSVDVLVRAAVSMPVTV